MRYVRPREYRFCPRQPVTELDVVVERYRDCRQTFSEEEALGDLWHAGEEIRLREDPRFWELAAIGQFHLAEQRLANVTLAERLWQGLWDGRNVDAELERLDAAHPGSFHVFCPCDPVLRLEGGAYRVVARARPAVPDDIRDRLDGASERLLEEHLSHGLPKATHDVVELLARLDCALDPPEDAIDFVESWLDSKDEWAEIARGLWLPASLVPQLVRRPPFRVRGVGSARGGTLDSVSSDGENLRATGESPSSYEPYPDPPVEQQSDSTVSWTHTLRALHIDAAYLPVPVAARFRYPRFVGRFGPLAIKAVLRETGAEGYLWLDREHHRLFGDLVQSLVEWQDAGRRLHLRWGLEAITVKVGDIDAEVQAEEARHVDPEALYALRRGQGESYRESLIEVLKASGPLPFRQLYDALSARVHHSPSRRSIRAILSASPDFVLQGKTWEWKETSGADRSFRRALVLSSLGLDPNAETVDVSQLANAAAARASEVAGDPKTG